jgi:hypothetical protein
MMTIRERAEATAALTYPSGSIQWVELAGNIEIALTEHVRALADDEATIEAMAKAAYGKPDWNAPDLRLRPTRDTYRAEMRDALAALCKRVTGTA